MTSVTDQPKLPHTGSLQLSGVLRVSLHARVVASTLQYCVVCTQYEYHTVSSSHQEWGRAHEGATRGRRE